MTNILSEGYDETKALVVALYNKFQDNPTVHTVETNVKSDAITLEQWVITNGYPLIMQDALALVTGALTGTPWASLVSSLIAQAKAQEATLEAGAAHVALNLAQSQLIVNGTIQPVTPQTVEVANAEAAVAATIENAPK